MSENNNQGWNGKTIKAPSGGGRRIKEITKEIDLGTILSLKQQQDKLEKTNLEVGLLKQRIINMTECISNHEGRIQKLENLLTDTPDIISILKRLETELLANVFGENSVPNGETVSLEKPPMDERGKPHCSLQNSIPKYCKFCGRELIYYKDTWICGHGCKKPAVKPDIKNLTNKELREFYMDKFIEKLKSESSKDIMIKAGNIITESLNKFSQILQLEEKIDKKRVQDALNKCFKHTLTYKGIIQVFPNAIYNIDGKDIVELYDKLGIKNNIDLKKR